MSVTVIGSGFIDSTHLVLKIGDVEAASTIFVSSTKVVRFVPVRGVIGAIFVPVKYII